MQMPAQQQLAVLVDEGAGGVAVEFGEIVPGVVEQSDAPMGALGRRNLHRLGQLVAADEQIAALLFLTSHPSGIEAGEM